MGLSQGKRFKGYDFGTGLRHRFGWSDRQVQTQDDSISAAVAACRSLPALQRGAGHLHNCSLKVKILLCKFWRGQLMVFIMWKWNLSLSEICPRMFQTKATLVAWLTLSIINRFLRNKLWVNKFTCSQLNSKQDFSSDFNWRTLPLQQKKAMCCWKAWKQSLAWM